MRRQLLRTLTLTLMVMATPVTANEIYKYQDAQGKWHFSDKKPKEPSAQTLKLKSTEKTKIEPIFYVNKNTNNNKNQLVVQNPFHAPIHVELRSAQIQRRKTQVIPALAKKTLLSATGSIEPFTYKWQLGDPKQVPGPQEYQLPVDALGCHRITQAFNGSFSHHSKHSRYAVDIALPVGTMIKAARKGVVVAVKDDYHMDGVDKFFLDKANYVRVVHSDGTFALYGHILLGTALVRVGYKVAAGAPLARSGSSGYSSGPHIHFVIHRNSGFAMTSVPFKFVGSRSQQLFVPIKGLRLCDV